MPFSMSFSKEQLSGAPPVPAGPYTLQFNGFKPAASKNKESLNLNASFSIVGMPEFANRKIFATMNMGGPWVIQDFVHACGLKMEVVQNGNVGTEREDSTIPGVFEGADQFPDDPSKWKYQGPLTNKTLQVELAETEYQGKKRNEIRQFFCQVPGCTDKHSTNLVKD